MTEAEHDPVKLFISYSHKDERFREQLREHLQVLKRQNLIEDWHDRRIVPGEDWGGAISENLEKSGIILLLVSSSFIASEYCSNVEMERALEKHESGEARVIPIILRPVDWDNAPFAPLQALPKNGRPVSKWSDRDEAWMDVARGIRQVAEELVGENGAGGRGPADTEGKISRYREAVESVWADGLLSRIQVQWLAGYSGNELRLGAAAAAEVEREVMGDTKEAILEAQERAAKRAPEEQTGGPEDRVGGDTAGREQAEDREGPPAPWEYSDFDLKITRKGEPADEPARYDIAVRSPEGEALAEMRFPFGSRELDDTLRDLEVALLRSGGTRRRLGTREERVVRQFGRALFEALLAGEIRNRYETSLREARRRHRGLRLKLHILPPELSALPWEFLYDPDRDYLCLSSRTPLVRSMALPQSAERLAVTPPLRILGMVANPAGLPRLDVEREKRLVEESVEALRVEGLVELVWLEGQSWRDLQREMRRGPWHVFHFVGHGGFDPATEEGAIALADEKGHTDLLRATSLARLLDDHFSLRLAFLNSCEGARGSESDAFSSTAAALVRRGVPAVVAMQYEITDEAAIEFSREFYEAISDGLPVDAAVAEARTAVSMKSALEWGTPVLYMRSPNGGVFDIRRTGGRRANAPKSQEEPSAPVLERKKEDPPSAPTPPDVLPGERERKPDTGKPPTLPGW